MSDNVIQLKHRSNADTNAPSSLENGELAVQMQDKKIYFKTNSGIKYVKENTEAQSEAESNAVALAIALG